ncbi:DUF2563 family protein [Mycobacterium sp.]|uniref:DUF2563 family protein n=1 Tax=Mycobacterium sp. TaxID=1785 RepID=UPI002C6DC088|nr:DUF2563 family protein [Mycobacterium sp.]HTQ22953.1 DUF2563 family protein [Mycobacterium sp.]
MFVDTGGLHSGANQSYQAGGHARDAADRLSRGPLSAGMFGDFSAADVFHEAVTSAHTAHVRILHAQHQTLTAVGDQAHRAAVEFTAMDELNAAKLRMGQCNSNT